MYSRVVLLGYVSSPIERRGQSHAAHFSVSVTNDAFQKRPGGKKVHYIPVRAYGPLADFVHTYFGRGDLIMLEGRLEQAKWKTSDVDAPLFVAVNSVTPLPVREYYQPPAEYLEPDPSDDYQNNDFDREPF